VEAWKAEFVELLRSRDSDDWEEAYNLKANHVPSRVYRYRSLNAEHAWDNLKAQQEWLSKAGSFNDPFDSGPCFDRERMVRAKFEADLAATKMDASFNVVVVQRETEQERRERTETDSTRLREGLQDRVRACCFSETLASVAMWAHYADCHRGICIEYPTDAPTFSKTFARELHPVIYGARRFDITDWLLSKDKSPGYTVAQAKLVAMHKAPDWAYEKEWRFIFPSTNLEWAVLNVPGPTAIYLGCRINPEHVERLNVLLPDVPLRRMRLAHRTYQMDVVE